MNTMSEGLRDRGAGTRRSASWVAFAVLLVLFVGALTAAGSMFSWTPVLAIAGWFAVLAVAGWMWGADTRDGSDWKPRKPGSIR